MVTNKAILGFFVVLIVVVLAIVLVRRNPNFMARFGRPTTETVNEETTPTENNETATPAVAGESAPSGLTKCTPELKARCNAAEAPVCGYERVESPDGTSERSLTFKSACAYCSLYGTDDVLDLGDEKYYPLGYTPGSCAVAK